MLKHVLRAKITRNAGSLRVLILSFFLGVSLGAPASAQSPLNAMQIELYKRALAMRSEADQKLLTKMEDCADWLVKFKQRYDHWPEPGTEQDEAREYLQSKILKANPFIDEYPYKDDLSKIPPPKVKFVLEATLTNKKRQDWEKKPPENWQEDPGTITIITNGEKCLLIWGASADKMPIADYKAKTYSFAWREFF